MKIVVRGRGEQVAASDFDLDKDCDVLPRPEAFGSPWEDGEKTSLSD